MEIKSLAIIGTADSRNEAPFHDKDVTIWVVDGCIEDPEITRADAAFELHGPHFWRLPQIIERLNSFDGPVYMQDHYDEIPNSVAYPREAVRKRFYQESMGKHLYVTNTITWMMLKGIMDGFNDFQLFGVHMAHSTEYAYQRPNVTWAAGLIQGLGGTVFFAGDAGVMEARYEYGFDEPNALIRAIDKRLAQLKAGWDSEDSKERLARENKLRNEGAMREGEHWRAIVAGQK